MPEHSAEPPGDKDESDVPSGQGPPEYDVMSPICVSAWYPPEQWVAFEPLSPMGDGETLFTTEPVVTYSDGIPIVWAGQRMGYPTVCVRIGDLKHIVRSANAMTGVADPIELAKCVNEIVIAYESDGVVLNGLLHNLTQAYWGDYIPVEQKEKPS